MGSLHLSTLMYVKIVYTEKFKEMNQFKHSLVDMKVAGLRNQAGNGYPMVQRKEAMVTRMRIPWPALLLMS